MWSPTVYSDELYHHGILGMKWGVRRYQNYDGTYTQAGLNHYRKSEEEYNKTNAEVKAAKKAYKVGTASKGDVKRAKIERKYAKKRLSKEYDQLKKDKLADQGKERYMFGKTIRGNNRILDTAVGALGTTATVAGYMASRGIGPKTVTKYGSIPVTALISAGSGALGVGLKTVGWAHNEHQAKKLRAYYGHSRPKFESSMSRLTTQKNIELQKTKKYDNVYKKKSNLALSGSNKAKADLIYMQSKANADRIASQKSKKSSENSSSLTGRFNAAKKDLPNLSYDKIYKEMKVNMNSEDPSVYKKAEDEWLKKHGY